MIILRKEYSSNRQAENISILNNDKIYNSINLLSDDDILSVIKKYIQEINEVSKLAKEKYGPPRNTRLKNTPVTIYIMTNENDLDYIDNKLKKVNYFDYGSVILFTGENLPCIDSNGKLLLECTNGLKTSDGGTGNVFKALRRYELMKKDM